MPNRIPNPKADTRIFDCSEKATKNKETIYNCSLLDNQSTIGKLAGQLKVLRLWNSSTPLFSRLRKAWGGFYYLVWNQKGVVIDPGFNFVDIFEREFKSIRDIDLVIVSHDHPDHCDGIESILTLLHEFNDRNRTSHTIVFALSQGTYSRFSSLFRKKNLKKHVVKLASNGTYTLLSDLEVSTVRNRHREICEDCDGLGLRFLLRHGASDYSFGISGDTGFHNGLARFYEGVDMLILHIGTLEDFSRHEQLKNHLGFNGIRRVLRKMKEPPSFALVSEWGEELLGMRKDIADHLEKYVPNIHILPADFNLTISIPGNEIYVQEDDVYAPASDVFVSNDYGLQLRYKVR